MLALQSFWVLQCPYREIGFTLIVAEFLGRPICDEEGYLDLGGCAHNHPDLQTD
jgi:hypothetical protein